MHKNMQLSRQIVIFMIGAQARGCGAPVDGWPNPLHEDVCSQAPRVSYSFLQCLPVQIVAAALPLRLQHKVLRPGIRLLEHLLRLWILLVVQAPQSCISAVRQAQMLGPLLSTTILGCTKPSCYSTGNSVRTGMSSLQSRVLAKMLTEPYRSL